MNPLSMKRISTSAAPAARHDVVVVGSGYGAAVAALRFSRAGRKVTVLERGREWRPEDFPSTQAETLPEVQVLTRLGRIGRADALVEARTNGDVDVVLGIGLGGGSLINAALAVTPDRRVFTGEDWPAVFRTDPDGALLARWIPLARSSLQSIRIPDSHLNPARTAALRRAAAALGASVDSAEMNIAFADRASGAGVHQPACTRCGDCVTGCRVGSKNTLRMNYLPLAAAAGAQLHTGVTVRSIARHPQGWRIFAEHGGDEVAFTCATVVLGAGSLGSTEILLRSAQDGLEVSPRVGRRWSGNGDVLGIAYNTDHPINDIGYGPLPVDQAHPCGPAITSLLRHDAAALTDSFLIADGNIPGPLARVLVPALAFLGSLPGADTDKGDEAAELKRKIASELGGPYVGAMQHTLALLMIGHDAATGRLQLGAEGVRTAWKDLGGTPAYRAKVEALRKATAAQGGRFIGSLGWDTTRGGRMATVHPLGGCTMADDARTGVVDHRGRVYSGGKGTQVHDDLFVLDGSIVPTSLGANPLLTITALAERAMAIETGEG